jgi:phage gp29-like protein
MKFGNINIGREGIFNVDSRNQAKEYALQTARNKANTEMRKKSDQVQKRISKLTLSRITANISRWQNARQTAESLINPNNTELIRVFKDIEIDAHLWALMQTVRLKVMANSFALYNSEGELDEEATDKFQKKWFRGVIKEAVDADFYGFSLVQLGDIENGCFSSSELVPREYVIQQRGGVKKSLSNSKDLIPFDSGSYKNWLIPIGNKNNLGLLDKAAPLVIKKKEVISAWSEAAEIFGIPMRIGKTNIQNKESKQNMEEMLENMGEAAWGVFDTEDDIELKEANKSDFSNMYDSFINRVNSELSKLIILQTGTTDEKAFVGSAEVHESILKDVIESYIIQVEDLANEVVIPICIRQGLLKPGTYLRAENEQKISPKELFEIVKVLLPQFNIPRDWITETFGVPIEDEEELNTNAEAQATLRSTVGGVTALLEIQRGVAAKTTTPEAAIVMIREIFGFDDQTAKDMLGDPKEVEVEVKTALNPAATPTSVMKAMAKLYGGTLEVVDTLKK